MPDNHHSPETQQFEHEGKLVFGHRVEVVGRSEPTSTFSLADGAVLSIRVLLVDVYKLEVTSPDGGPIYRYGSSITTHIWPAKQPDRKDDKS